MNANLYEHGGPDDRDAGVGVPLDRGSAATPLSSYERGRELGLKVAALFRRVARPIARRWMSFHWAVGVHAAARQVGPQVHAYGSVRFLGTGNVLLGGWGNIYDNVLFETVDAGVIRVGDHFRINRGCLLSAHVGITLGDGCLVGEYVSIRDSNHVFEDAGRPIGEQGYRAAPISIGDDVWIGRGAVILQGITIGPGSVIAANSVVTKDVPGMEVWAGIPARFLRRRGAADK